MLIVWKFPKSIAGILRPHTACRLSVWNHCSSLMWKKDDLICYLKKVWVGLIDIWIGKDSWPILKFHWLQSLTILHLHRYIEPIWYEHHCQIPLFVDHKAHLKSFNFLKIKSAPYNVVRLMYESVVLSHLEPILCGKRCYLFNYCCSHGLAMSTACVLCQRLLLATWQFCSLF